MESDEEGGGPEGSQKESSEKGEEDQTVLASTDEEEETHEGLELDLTVLGLSAEDHTDFDLSETEGEEEEGGGGDGEHGGGFEEEIEAGEHGEEEEGGEPGSEYEEETEAGEHGEEEEDGEPGSGYEEIEYDEHGEEEEEELGELVSGYEEMDGEHEEEEEEDGKRGGGFEEIEEYGEHDEEETLEEEEEEEREEEEEEEKEGSEHSVSHEDISDMEAGEKPTLVPEEDTVDYLEDDEGVRPMRKTSELQLEALQVYDEVAGTSGYPPPDMPDYASLLVDEISERLIGIDEPDVINDDSLTRALADLPSAFALHDFIEPFHCQKPFLGGFVRPSTGVEYHNASAQAAIRPPPSPDADGSGDSASKQKSRETQTHETWHLLMQTMNDTSTQMTGIGVYVPNITDRVLASGKYETADERELRQTQQVITVQKYFRRWWAKVTIERMLKRKKCLDEMLDANNAKAEEEKRKRLQKNYERRMHPRTTEDFDLLFTYLEKWRRKEVERINNTLEKHHRKAALCDLMDKQAQLIHCIGMRRLEIADPLHLALVSSFLEKVAAPVKLVRGDREILIEDNSILQAQEFKEVFLSLNLKDLTSEERLDLLITVKTMLRLNPCSVSAELDKLIDRERDLLARGFSGRALEGLRRRISHMFFQYIKLPSVNPATKRFAKVPSDPMVLRGNMTVCSSCHRYLTPNDFQLAANLRKVGRCQDCTRLDNRARKRKDFSIYRYMLKNIRRAEDMQNGNSKIVYLMQEKDFRYLISYIWHGRSVISAHDDLFDLEFVRWDRCEEWSPWNCVLLTKDEARIHGKFRNLKRAYRKDFLHEIHCRHLAAKKYFHRLLMMAPRMPDTSSEESTAVRNIAKKYLTAMACNF